ncbi:carcinoembryonic antigen-related cell adhesion molecule 5-like [Hypanus sabinus]|uniref:carcinoembryonic antigen-related cell adhesion molecule 5-like n=1 Tax=Hypanus sabinus TaxID=79690 RepID=UPI0028C3A9F5|nr:carcinoembryonic antigen-related cell adhesion molecule 5-like [Hypanus sabinus]
MSGLPFAALVLCLHITAGESQQFTIIIEHSQINVTAGGEALFSVRPSSSVSSGSWNFNGLTVAQWIGQTGTIDNVYRSRAELFTSNGSLLLKSVNVSDSGEYRVNMVPISGSQTSATVTLRVTEPVSNVTATSNATMLIEYSDTVRLTCSATGTDVSYLWLEDNSVIIPGGRFELSADHSTLTVSGVLRSDGNFTCRASNLINEITSNPLYLDVHYGPDLPHIITQPDSPFHVAGSTVRLTCFSESRPSAELNWQLNGAHLQSGQEVVLDSISVSHTGEYTCEAYNRVTKRINASTTQINVFEPVSNVTVTSNATMLIEYSDTVRLTCSARGTDVSYLWLEDNSVITPGGRFELSADNSTLTVSGVLRSDGNFTCRASNLINEITSDPLYLDVYNPLGNGSKLESELISKHTGITARTYDDIKLAASKYYVHFVDESKGILIVFTGTVAGVAVVANASTPLENLDTVALSCDASGTVQTRTWFKDNQPIKENGRIFTSPDKANLTIIRVNRNDAGTYKCIASNSFSSGAGEIYVQVYCKYTVSQPR